MIVNPKHNSHGDDMQIALWPGESSSSMLNGMMLAEPTGDDNIVILIVSGVLLSEKEVDKPKVSSRQPLLSRQEG